MSGFMSVDIDGTGNVVSATTTITTSSTTDDVVTTVTINGGTDRPVVTDIDDIGQYTPLQRAVEWLDSAEDIYESLDDREDDKHWRRVIGTCLGFANAWALVGQAAAAEGLDGRPIADLRAVLDIELPE